MSSKLNSCPHRTFSVMKFKHKRYRCTGCSELFTNDEIGALIDKKFGGVN